MDISTLKVSFWVKLYHFAPFMIAVPQFKNLCTSFDFALCNPHDRTDRQRTTRVTAIYTKLPPQPPQYTSESPESQSAHNIRSVNFWQSGPYLYQISFQCSLLNILILITGPLSGDCRRYCRYKRTLQARDAASLINFCNAGSFRCGLGFPWEFWWMPRPMPRGESM